MAVYTDVGDAELEPFLARYGLGPAITFKGIAEGVENSNFLLETDSERFILTVYERRVRMEDLPYFLDLMGWLAAHDFPCPLPRADLTGKMLQQMRGKPAALVSFLNGVPVRHPDARHCHEAGRGLARLHRAGDGFPAYRPNDLGPSSWPALFRGQEHAADALKSGLASTITEDLEGLRQGWPGDLPTGVVHADLFPDNVFFMHETFAAAIDFYFACNDALAYDLAVCLNSWCFDDRGTLEVGRARALIAGYESVRPLGEAERHGLPVLTRGAAMRFFLTRLIDWGSTPAGALVRPKDPLEYERKLDFLRSSEAAAAFASLATARDA